MCVGIERCRDDRLSLVSRSRFIVRRFLPSLPLFLGHRHLRSTRDHLFMRAVLLRRRPRREPPPDWRSGPSAASPGGHPPNLQPAMRSPTIRCRQGGLRTRWHGGPGEDGEIRESSGASGAFPARLSGARRFPNPVVLAQGCQRRAGQLRRKPSEETQTPRKSTKA